MSSTHQFDAVVYGATGYTGRLVAEHLLKTYGAGGDLKLGDGGTQRRASWPRSGT